MTLRLLSRIGKRYGVREGLSADSCGIGSRLGEINFRVARQLPKFVTWAELDFYDLPLIRPMIS